MQRWQHAEPCGGERVSFWPSEEEIEVRILCTPAYLVSLPLPLCLFAVALAASFTATSEHGSPLRKGMWHVWLLKVTQAAAERKFQWCVLLCRSERRGKVQGCSVAWPSLTSSDGCRCVASNDLSLQIIEASAGVIILP